MPPSGTRLTSRAILNSLRRYTGVSAHQLTRVARKDRSMNRSRVIACLCILALIATTTVVAHAEEPADTPLVVIDPGHGGPYSNANANGLREKNVNLAIALELREALLLRGYRVVMTRTTDRAVETADIATWRYRYGVWRLRKDGLRGSHGLPKDDLQARCNVANSMGADCFISIHCNGASRRTARGYETYASSRDPDGVQLATWIHRGVMARTRTVNRGAHKTDFYVLRWTDCPAVLIESGFISSKRDAAALRRSAYVRRIAAGVALGVDAWFAKRRSTPRYPRVAADSSAALAVALSAIDHPANAPAVVVADAREATAVAGAASVATSLSAPLLWVNAGDDASTIAEIARLAPAQVVAVTAGVLDEATVTSLVRAAGSAAPVRILAEGAASGTSSATCEFVGPSAKGEVFVAPAEEPAAVFAAAAAAAADRAPLLIAAGGVLPTTQSAWLSANASATAEVVLVGSADRVPDAIAGGLPVVRNSATSLASALATLDTKRFDRAGHNTLSPVVVDRRDAAGLLSAATHAGLTRSPIVPVTGATLSGRSREWLTNHRSQVRGFQVLSVNGTVPVRLDAALSKADR
jgi:N-acetylmuramoyl-L-alanine amidase